MTKILTANSRSMLAKSTNKFFKLDARFIFRTALVLVLVTSFFVSDLNAQRRAGQKPKLGDIIEYTETSGGTKYGLVIELGSVLVVENVDYDGNVDTDRVFPSARIRIVDAFQKNSASRLRVWTTSDGKFEVKAKVVGVEDGKVDLQKEDGRIVTVPINKLGSKDQRIIKSLGDGPFEIDVTGDLPEEVGDLIKRRGVLMAKDNRHQRLARLSQGFVIGDIIQFNDFHDGLKFGVVVELGRFGPEIEVVEGDKTERAMGFNARNTRWTYYDREIVSAPLEERTWSSATGKFSVRARLVAVEGEKLVLKKTDGETIKVAASQLSKIDQNYSKRVKSKLSVRNDEQLEIDRENYGPELQKLLARRADVLKLAVSNRIAASDASKMKTVRLSTGRIELSSPQLRPMGLGSRSMSVSFPMRMAENARVGRVCYARESGHVALAASSPFRGLPTLAVVDTNTERVVTNIDSDEVGHEGEVVAISPSGRILIVYSGNHRDRKLELWHHEDERLMRKSMISYDSSSAPVAHLFDDQSGVIMNNKGEVVFFDVLDRIAPSHSIPTGRFARNNRFQVSRDQKHIFYFDGNATAMYIIDAETKKCVGGVPFRQTESGLPVAFAQVNPDGKTASYINRDKFVVYSLESGEAIGEHTLPRSYVAFGSRLQEFQYFGPNLVLVSNSVFDLKRGSEIGTVKSDFARDAQYFADGTRIVGGEDRSSGRGEGGFGRTVGAKRRSARSAFDRDADYADQPVKVSLQSLPVRDIVSHAKSLTEADFVDFGSGDSLQVKIKLDSNPSLERQLKTKIESIMSDGGIDVVGASDFVLELRYKVGERQTENYVIVDGLNRRPRQVSITPKSISATLTYKGERIWSRGESASLGHPIYESDLDDSVKKAQNMSPRKLLDYDYPTKLYVLLPSRSGKFRWQ